MSAFIDLSGQRFGKWTVVTRDLARCRWGQSLWKCTCDCGNTRSVVAYSLRHGRSVNCGCMRREQVRARATTHGHTASPTYTAWANMIQRCKNARNKRFKDYGGRGIKVCDRWHGFTVFLADMGEKPPGLTLDRIDNDGNYEPGNCRWATAAEQRANKRARRRREHGRAADSGTPLPHD